jgi:nucleotide-binding universal stress UspA family protein
VERELIVIGVDGSPRSVAALHWGIAEAGRRDADVEVLMCWHPPYIVEASGYGVGYVSPEEMSAGARAELDRMVAEFDADITRVRGDGRQVTERLLEGPPGPTLVTEAKAAAMLVVGRRGHSRLARLVLGSVSHYAAEHGVCPVVIVPEP